MQSDSMGKWNFLLPEEIARSPAAGLLMGRLPQKNLRDIREQQGALFSLIVP